MRNLIGVGLLLVMVGFSGFFVVEQREIGVVNPQSAHPQLYKPGVHWKMPLLGTLYLVYTNTRTALIGSTQVLTTADQQHFSANVVFHWQVVDPVQYLSTLNSSGHKLLEKELSQVIFSQLTAEAATATRISDVIAAVNQLSCINVPRLGVKIISLAVTQITPVTFYAQAELSRQPQLAKFKAALQIKQQAELSAKQQLQSLAAKDRKFYNYYMQIQQLRKQATTKDNVPPLSQIF